MRSIHEQAGADPFDGFDDPLAVEVGIWAGVPAGTIPAEGWPDTFKPEVIGRILSYLPLDDEVL